jgi:hypothetical protein
MRLAATYGDTWVTTGERSTEGPVGAPSGARHVADQVRRLEEACAEVGRDAGSLQRLVLSGPVIDSGLASPEAFRETVGRFEEVGVTDFVVHWPRPCEPYAGDLAMFERIFTT